MHGPVNISDSEIKTLTSLERKATGDLQNQQRLVERHHTPKTVETSDQKKVKYDNWKVLQEMRKNKEGYILPLDFSVQEGQVDKSILDGYWSALIPDLGKLLRT